MNKNYEAINLLQPESEHDPFTVERYHQFFKHFPVVTQTVLDIGCNTGRGGKVLKELNPNLATEVKIKPIELKPSPILTVDVDDIEKVVFKVTDVLLRMFQMCDPEKEVGTVPVPLVFVPQSARFVKDPETFK